MALSGLLSDFGVIELVQYPHNRKRTGELRISTPMGIEAKCYYREGRLVHVVSPDHEGIDALVDIVGLEEGEFHFDQSSTTSATTIEMDLHRAVMQALKIADERKKTVHEESSFNENFIGNVTRYLEQLIAEKKELYMLSLVDTKCQTIAEVFGESAENRKEMRDIRKHLCDIFTTFPVGLPRSIIIHHNELVVTLGKTPAGLGLVVIAPPADSLGMINMLVKRSATEIDAIMERE